MIKLDRTKYTATVNPLVPNFMELIVDTIEKFITENLPNSIIINNIKFGHYFSIDIRFSIENKDIIRGDERIDVAYKFKTAINLFLNNYANDIGSDTRLKITNTTSGRTNYQLIFNVYDKDYSEILWRLQKINELKNLREKSINENISSIEDIFNNFKTSLLED